MEARRAQQERIAKAGGREGVGAQRVATDAHDARHDDARDRRETRGHRDASRRAHGPRRIESGPARRRDDALDRIQCLSAAIGIGDRVEDDVVRRQRGPVAKRFGDDRRRFDTAFIEERRRDEVPAVGRDRDEDPQRCRRRRRRDVDDRRRERASAVRRGGRIVVLVEQPRERVVRDRMIRFARERAFVARAARCVFAQIGEHMTEIELRDRIVGIGGRGALVVSAGFGDAAGDVGHRRGVGQRAAMPGIAREQVGVGALGGGEAAEILEQTGAREAQVDRAGMGVEQRVECAQRVERDRTAARDAQRQRRAVDERSR